jgi:hypothetical protein
VSRNAICKTELVCLRSTTSAQVGSSSIWRICSNGAPLFNARTNKEGAALRFVCVSPFRRYNLSKWQKSEHEVSKCVEKLITSPLWNMDDNTKLSEVKFILRTMLKRESLNVNLVRTNRYWSLCNFNQCGSAFQKLEYVQFELVWIRVSR